MFAMCVRTAIASFWLTTCLIALQQSGHDSVVLMTIAGIFSLIGLVIVGLSQEPSPHPAPRLFDGPGAGGSVL